MSIKLSFLPNELVVAGTPLTIEASRPLDHHTCHEKVKICGSSGVIEDCTSIEDNTICISTDDFEPGIYGINIGRLRDHGGEHINDHPLDDHKIFVTKLCGQIPSHFRIVHAVHLAIGETESMGLRPGVKAPEGMTYVERIIVADRSTHVVKTLSFDEGGKSVDSHAMLKDLDQRRAAKFGAIEERLWKILETAEDEKVHEVAIWPSLEHNPISHRPTEQTASNTGNAGISPHISAFKRPKENIISILSNFQAPIEQYDDLPHIRTRLTKSQVHELSASEFIFQIFHGTRRSMLMAGTHPARNSNPRHQIRNAQLASNRGDRAHIAQSAFGNHVRLAIHERAWDHQLDEAVVRKYKTNQDIVIEKTFRNDLPPPTENEKGGVYHPRLIAAIVKNTRPHHPHHGFAPQCTVYSANTDEEDSLRWAVKEMGCSIISESFTTGYDWDSDRSEADSQPFMTLDDVLRDWMAVTEPYPLFVRCASNEYFQDRHGHPAQGQMWVGPKNFNGLSVGSHSPDGKRMTELSVWKNPGLPGNNSDRELPDICACGEDVNCLEFTHKTGTSAAAPAVAGIAALIQGVREELQKIPEACRAILYASCGRRAEFKTSTWMDDLILKRDLHGGAGMIDAEAAVIIARRFFDSDNTPTHSGGWGWGLVSGSDMGADQRSWFCYSFRVPAQFAVKKVKAKIALAFHSTITYSDPARTIRYASILDSSYDLHVINANTGNLEGISVSFDNSYEIVDMTVVFGVTYQIYIAQHAITPEAEARQKIRYGIAWNMYVDGTSIPS